MSVRQGSDLALLRDAFPGVSLVGHWHVQGDKVEPPCLIVYDYGLTKSRLQVAYLHRAVSYLRAGAPRRDQLQREAMRRAMKPIMDLARSRGELDIIVESSYCLIRLPGHWGISNTAEWIGSLFSIVPRRTPL